MAYFALPTRDSAFLLLANAAPRLPRNSAVTLSTSCSLVDGAPLRPLRVQSPSLFGARLTSNFNPRGRRILASVEGNVTVEEAAVSVGSEESAADAEEKAPEVAAAAEATESSDAPAKRLQRGNTMQRQSGGAKREITVTKEQLVPGAVFSGKVRAVQSYGAFVDIGAFTDGLVHISQLSSSYVKEVSEVVSVGQEVSVTVVELNETAGRIALSMRDKESESEQQASRSGGESGTGSGSQEDGSGRPMNRGKIAGRGAKANSRSNDDKKTTKLKKGQELKGTVKNIIRNGAFIEFVEEGEEGFLRGSEITEGGENVAVDTLLTVGQEVTVRVLKIERGRAALTMKPQVDVTSINDSINTNVGAGGASNPFATFFRSANMVSETPASVDAPEETAAAEEVSAVQDSPGATEESAAVEDVPAVEDAPATEAVQAEAPAAEEDSAAATEEVPAVEDAPATEAVQAEAPAAEEDSAAATEEVPAVEDAPATEAVQAEAPSAEEGSESTPPAEEPHSLSLGEIAENIGSAVKEVEKVVEAAADLLHIGDKDGAALDEGSDATPASSAEDESRAEAQPAEATVETPVAEPQEAETVPEAAPEPVAESPAPVDSKAAASEEPKAAAPAEPKATAGASGPTAAQVKALREKSGAGMMECKKALVACENDLEKASEYLRKKGLASADKKASRIAAEGRVGSYVHDGRMGVLIEINCETDFVSRGTQFKELVADMGMQVVACPDVKYVSVDDVPAEFVAKEKEIEMGKEDLASKPEQIREKIVEGRIAKRLAELALLEQAYIRDDKVVVKDHVKEAIAKLGEKIQIRRFVRFNLGEGLEKKSVDFAAEVAAQTAAKADVKPAAEQAPKVEEKKEEEGPKVVVSAATVKQLRDATGAGMMECKKALGACENDVEKATEYLRKKGLASADKKSGRIATEGLIGSYIHDGRIGVLVEVNSETDFVARSKEFKELVANIGMQVAACPQVQYVTVDEIPASFIEKEKEIEGGKEDLAKRPAAIREKIVEGRVAKTLNELALLEQPYIRDDKILVRDYVKQTIAALGENIQVRRFERFNLGEGIEKRSTDFAAEVAAQTGAKL
ncbi:hypothetical protein KC19_4G168400 [Ceratodon purpureus]|uniref:Elongation factor Ts, mitochondrial n=1 Tax=Ceratodon purpureus TaxID=3225 RepID=A0A8T0IAC8_CERPU|nr:hypothetical protein KC19_4G168400 [Ceratodon purpureus]KAG0580372.1 hypothetical protein KC19_4G168400 [Ceratodon purpureus]KAG0580374.1 hypothetical protein KC19_4G168400 [Ceratodon purpureus]